MGRGVLTQIAFWQVNMNQILRHIWWSIKSNFPCLYSHFLILVCPSDQKGEGKGAGNLAFQHLEFRIMPAGLWLQLFFSTQFLSPSGVYEDKWHCDFQWTMGRPARCGQDVFSDFRIWLGWKIEINPWVVHAEYNWVLSSGFLGKKWHRKSMME